MTFTPYRTTKKVDIYNGPPGATQAKKGIIYKDMRLSLARSASFDNWLTDENGDYFRDDGLEVAERLRATGGADNVLHGLSDEEITARYGWAISELEVGKLWERSSGDGVVIAVVDSGIEEDHPILKGSRIRNKENFWHSGRSISDTLGHGTSVSSILVGYPDLQDATNAPGVVGLAPHAELLVALIMVLPPVSGQAARAIQWAEENGADIIVTSWGVWDSDAALQHAVLGARAKGVVVVASAGDDTKNTPIVQYPANYPDVLTVGSLSDHDTPAGNCPVNSAIQLMAPGANIHIADLSALVQTDGNGTSFAAPLAAGVLALLMSRAKSRKPEMNKVERAALATAALTQTARKLSSAQRSTTGKGAIDPIAALNLIDRRTN